jgi:hypothetical protein
VWQDHSLVSGKAFSLQAMRGHSMRTVLNKVTYVYYLMVRCADTGDEHRCDV